MALLATSLLQALLICTLALPVAQGTLLLRKGREVVRDGQQACAPLANKGTYFTVDVEVGTPGQRFSLVADTGSNTLIVPSCICQQMGFCSHQDRCFRGTNHSSTFVLVKDKNRPVSIIISFGSGLIRGVIAREEVMIGGMQAYMNDGILLMTGKALDFGGPFEGIMGLGIPSPKEERPPQDHHSDDGLPGGATDVAMGRKADGEVPDWMKTFNPDQAQGGWAEAEAIRGQTDPRMSQPPGFLEQANISRFAICFNSGKSGVLRMGVHPQKDAVVHSSLGVEHWGLGLDGISISGNRTVSLDLCSSKDMLPGQDTPCGAIPDSGTTMIMGPTNGVRNLLNTLCDHWPRCAANFTALGEAAAAAKAAAARSYGFSPFEIAPWPKYKVLEFLLMDCEAWLDDSAGSGLDELPAVHFHVVGGNGTRQKVHLPAHSYVLELSVETFKEKRHGRHRKNTSSLHEQDGSASGDDVNDDGISEEDELAAEDALLQGHSKVCAPAFGSMEYKTRRNGPVWILGTPLFYQYNVGYDLGTTPPSMSLQSTKESPCGSCNGEVGLVTAHTDLERAGSTVERRPLRMEGQPRMPSFDTSRPL